MSQVNNITRGNARQHNTPAERDVDLYSMRDGIVDIVRCDDGLYALGADASLTIVRPFPVLWLPPRQSEVKESLLLEPQEIFNFLRAALATYADLPTPEYHDLHATWVFLSYIHRWFPFSPQLFLYADQERGKSRIGSSLAYTSFRGFITETVNEAYLFRLGATGYSVCLDVINAEEKVRSKGSLDILAARFQRGVKVPRVNRPEAVGLAGIDCYECYGPTIVLTNNPIDSRWESRGFLITPPVSKRRFGDPPTEEALLPVREMLTAWRWRMLKERPAIPSIPGLKHGRFRDITKPLRQVAALVSPEPKRVDAALEDIYERRQESRAMSDEANLIAAIEAAPRRDGHIFTSDIHKNFAEITDWRPSRKWIGGKLDALGLRLEMAGKNRLRAIRYDERLIEELRIKYGGKE